MVKTKRVVTEYKQKEMRKEFKNVSIQKHHLNTKDSNPGNKGQKWI